MATTTAAGKSIATSCAAAVSESRSDAGKVTMVSSRLRSLLRTPSWANVATSRPTNRTAKARVSRSTSAARRTLGTLANGSMTTSASAGGSSLISGFTSPARWLRPP